MSAIFCCSSISPYRPQRLDHEVKFDAFMQWANDQTTSLAPGDGSLVSSVPYAIQLVRQINYGKQESIRYFFPAGNGFDFAEATEDDLLNANFDKVNSYKNFRCEKHDKFFEVNLYQKNPTNAHHWRVNLARPSRDIDLALRRKEPEGESSKKMKESVGQEKKQERRLSDIQGKASSPEPRASLSHTIQKANDAAHQPASQPNIATLKGVLRLLLPRVGRSLGSSSLLSLLCLDWANEELDLGLEFENLWEAELTNSNILIFFRDCFASYASTDVEVDLGGIGDLVAAAMRHDESRKEQQLAGRAKLHGIVNWVLESDCTSDWVSVYGDIVANVFTSGPGEELLELCLRNDRLQQDLSNQNIEEIHGTQSERVLVIESPSDQLLQDDEEVAPWMRRDDYDDYVYDAHDYDHDSDESIKDLTACDKECGYCGKCDY